jgi:hypothetical protein
MTRDRHRQALSLLAVCLWNPWAAAAAPPAQLVTYGQVLVNAAALPSGTTIHEGDRITTGDQARALLVQPGIGRVEIRHASEIDFTAEGIVLRAGAVGTEKANIRLGPFTIAPQAEEATVPWVVVALHNNEPFVAVYRGKAMIARPGAEPVVVTTGSYALPDSAGQIQMIAAAAGSAGPIIPAPPPAASGGAAQSGWTIGPLSHAASVAVAAAGAGAVGGVVAAAALTEVSPSPSR